MKRHYELYQIVKLIVAFEIAFCIIWTFTLFLINGAGAFSVDHALLLFIIALTITSITFMKKKAFFKKAVLWMALVPFLLVVMAAKPGSSTQRAKSSGGDRAVYLLSKTVR